MADEPTYTTLEDLKRTLELAGESFADDDLTLAIESASRMIDEDTGRSFAAVAADAEPSERIFTAASYGAVVIDDATEVLAVATDTTRDGTFSTVWESGSWRTTPVNAQSTGRPIRRIETLGRMVFPQGASAVRVTANWGWPAVPPQIEQATRILATRLMRRSREAPLGVAGFGADGMAVRISRSDPDVAALLAPFRRLGFP